MRGAEVEMVVASSEFPRLNTVEVATVDSGSNRLATLYAWRVAVLNGRLSEAAALRGYVESFEEVPAAADAEWQ